MSLNNILEKMNLIHIFRTFYLKAEEYTFFSSAYGMFSRIGHMSSHMISLNKFKNTKIVSHIFFNHNGMS